MKRGIALPLLAAMSAAVLVWNGFVTPPQPSLTGQVDFLPPNTVDVAMETIGVPGSQTLLTVNGTEITTQQYLYWLGNQTDQFYQTMYAYGMTDLDLSEEMEDGVTWDDWLKDMARQQVIIIAQAEELGREYGVELTAEELQALVQTRQNNIDAMGGEEGYSQRLQAFGIDDEAFFDIQARVSLLSKIEEEVTAVDETCTPEEAAQYAEENDLLRAKHILLLTKDMSSGESYDEATVAQQRAKAEDLLAQLRADPSRFDELMTANSEDSGLESNPDGYLFTAGQMVSEFEDTTRALDYGEISDIVESAYGYHIILRLDPDCDALRQAVARTRQSEASEAFSQTLYDWVETAQVETDPLYDSITADDYYQKLLAYQATFEEPEVEDAGTAELEPAS